MTNKGKLALAALLAVPVVLLTTTKTEPVSNAQFANKKLARGLRNNNPGNLRKSSVAWAGKISNPLDTAFESFDTMANGVRAAIRNAYTHWNRGKNTVATLISIWAPPTENNTIAYVAAVAKEAGISPNAQIKWGNNDTTAKLMYAIFKHENGADTSKYISLAQVRAQLATMWP
jgi:hypothetical protein